MSESVVLRWWVPPIKNEQNTDRQQLQVYGFRVDAFTSNVKGNHKAWPATLFLFVVDTTQPLSAEIERATTKFKDQLDYSLQYPGSDGSQLLLAAPWAEAIVTMFNHRIHAQLIPFIIRQDILPDLEWLELFVDGLEDGFEEYLDSGDDCPNLKKYMPVWIQNLCKLD